MHIFTIIFMVFLFGCGSETKKEDDSPVDVNQPVEEQNKQAAEEEIPMMSFAVEDQTKLPECTEKNNGALAYSKTQYLFYHCQFTTIDGRGSWAQVLIIGKDGADGKDGENGKDGTNGNNKIIKRLDCRKDLISTVGVVVNYSNTVFNSGDVFVTASISSGQIQASNSVMYAQSQIGAENGGITVVYDLWDNPTSGWWNFVMNSARLGVNISFNDGEMPGDGKDEWYSSRAANECTEYTFN